MNRLASALSPYLRQHADNPVHWREWGADAFAEARERDVPILLSIGYAACHWCHVMAHESFEDAAVAAQMNASYVCIKVDREERPDIDSVYMAAVVAMTGQGGWPMTVVLTPDGAPVYAGTYFPPTPAHGLPSFPQVLDAVAQAWGDQREALVEQGGRLLAHLREHPAALSTLTAPPSTQDLAEAVQALAREWDRGRGGFAAAPKFPPTMNLEQLLRHHGRTGDPLALEMVVHTCEAMARGGIYDQLSGGFARYSVDAGWVVPHFEKMLYDNAQLLGLYARLWRTTSSPLALRVASETAELLLTELLTAEGAFASSLDADTDGREGAFAVWTPAELAEALGPHDAAWAAELLGVTAAGTFEDGASVLRLARPGLLDEPGGEDRWARLREELRTVRGRRTQPGRDDKVVAGWNGLAIASLAEAGMICARPDWVEAAVRAAEHVVGLHWAPAGRRLHRVSLGGRLSSAAGVLEDYALLADGLLVLFSATGDPRWSATAQELLDVVLERFVEPLGDALTFFDTPAADDGTTAPGEEPATDDGPPRAADMPLLVRPGDPGDNASPSGRSAAAGALLRSAALTGSRRHREAAEAALSVYPALARQAPRFAGHALAVAEALADGPREIAIVLPRAAGDEPAPSAGPASSADPATAAAAAGLVRAAWGATAPGAVVVVGQEGAEQPLLAGRPAPVPTAYVCRGFVCALPVTSASALRTSLAAPLSAG